MPTDSRRSFEETEHRRRFGARIKQLRESYAWSQDKLAERAGMDRGYIAGLENGSRNPTLDNIHRVAVALEVGIADLFTS